MRIGNERLVLKKVDRISDYKQVVYSQYLSMNELMDLWGSSPHKNLRESAFKLSTNSKGPIVTVKDATEDYIGIAFCPDRKPAFVFLKYGFIVYVEDSDLSFPYRAVGKRLSKHLRILFNHGVLNLQNIEAITGLSTPNAIKAMGEMQTSQWDND